MQMHSPKLTTGVFRFGGSFMAFRPLMVPVSYQFAFPQPIQKLFYKSLNLIMFSKKTGKI